MHPEKSYVDKGPFFLFYCSENGTLLFVNETLCSKLGFTSNELMGQKVDTIFPIATRIFYQTHLFPLLKMQQHAEEIFVTLKTKDNKEIPVLLNAERKMNDEPVIVFAAILVNNRKKFEEELIGAKNSAEKALNENIAISEAKQQLQQHVKQLDLQINMVNKQNEELRQFNHVVTHSLQEPLRKLSVYADILQQSREKYDQQKAASKLMKVLAQMRELVAGLQQYIWLSKTSYTQVDLDNVLQQSVEKLKQKYADVKLIIENETLPVIRADGEQMQLLFFELLDNAIKFRKPGSTANIKINAAVFMRNTFKNIAGKYEYAEFVKIEITDTGVGFKNEYNEQVFQLFRKLHNENGQGVGLALCKKIAENHHGSISITSNENKATTVELLLAVDASLV